jgi:hypothetical protein
MYQIVNQFSQKSSHGQAAPSARRSRFWIMALISGAILLGTCTMPHERIEMEAARLGFDKQVVRGDGFDHVVYQRAGELDRSSGRLHVYLEGDGTPWRTRTEASQDPTPRNPLTLRLMAQDDAPALYLGRPCYFGLARSSGCHPGLWTHRRYGPKVVDSMAAALSRLLAPIPETELWLIGYSGGGTLAMLLAERFPQTSAIITVAGNLDVGRWTDHHKYTPLVGSLDPARRPPLRGVKQVHFVGGRDSTVPPKITRAFVGRQGVNVFLIEYAEFDHRCCWESVWPILLDRSDSILNGEPMQPLEPVF